MASETVTGSLIFTHAIPALFGFLSIILICIGIMDRKQIYTFAGIGLFFAAVFLPFLILPVLLGI
jgi:hypothetical protein